MNTWRVFHSDMNYKSHWMQVNTSKSLTDWILYWLQAEYWIYDADTCGTRELEWVVEDPTTGDRQYFRTIQDWYYQHDEEDGWNWANEFDIQSVSSVEFEYPNKDRDWMTLTA